MEDGAAYHGRRHARIVTDKGFAGNLWFRPQRMTGLPDRFTFSVYLRSAKPGGRIRLVIWRNDWGRNHHSKMLKPGRHWQRYTYTTTLKPYPADDYRGKPNIYFCGITNIDGGELDIDAVQLERGGLTRYWPQKRLRICGRTDAYANTFIQPGPIRFKVGVSNYSDREVSGTCETSVRDYLERLVLSHSEELKSRPRQATEFELTLPTNANGYFRVESRLLLQDGSVADTHVINMARVEDIDDGKPHPESSVGIHARGAYCADPKLQALRWRLVRNSGARWNRQFVLWLRVEPRRGTFIWDYFDKRIDTALKNRMQVLLCFGGPAPKWAELPDESRRAGYPVVAEAAQLRFVRTCLERYRGKVAALEIRNEPYGQFQKLVVKPKGEEVAHDYVRWYADHHAKVASLARDILPGVPLLANLSGGPPHWNDEDGFPALAIKRGVLKLSDVVSCHFYPGLLVPEATRDRDFFACANTIREYVAKYAAGRDMELWQTEAAPSSDDLFDDANNLYGEYRQHMGPFGYTSEIQAARIWIRSLIIRKAAGFTRDFHFVIGNSTAYFTLFSMFKDRWLSPKVIYPAHNVYSDLLGEAVFVKRTAADDYTCAYAFASGDRAVVAYWHYDTGMGLGKLTLAGEPALDSVLDFMGNAVEPETRAEARMIPVDESPGYLLLGSQRLGPLMAAMRSAKRAHESAIRAHVALDQRNGASSVVVKVRNAGPTPAMGQIRVAKTPLGLRLGRTLLAYGSQPSDTTRSYHFPIASLTQPCEGRLAGVVRHQDRLYEFERQVAVLCSSRVLREIRIDGRADEWNLNQPHITLSQADQIAAGDPKQWRGPDDLAADVWSCWDEGKLYLLIRVQDSHLSPRPDRPHLGDCVELFLDLDPVRDVEHTLYDDDDHQLFFIPPDRSGGPATTTANTGQFVDTRYACTATRGGYVMEIAFLAQALTRQTLSVGTTIGFDVAIDDRDDGDSRKLQMIWHGDGQAFKLTDRFGFLVLETAAPGE